MLASVQRVISVESIPNSDRIELVKMENLGWNCVVRKGEFAPGDLCVYIEIDTIIPKSLLDSEYTGEDRVRLITVKMRGQLSQGLVLPYKILSEPAEYLTDVSSQLKIEKYEKAIPASLQGLARGNFPTFLIKTDEVRIQAEPKLLEMLKGQHFYITTKMDGMSSTFYKWEGKFGVCSRNLDLQDGGNVYWRMARQYDIETWLPEGYCLQGEICGEGIQGNKLKLTGQQLFLFNVFNIKTQRYEFLFNVSWIPESVTKVPLEESGDNFDYDLDTLLERAKGRYTSGELKEGIVVRSVIPGISFKVLNNDFLLKNRE